MFVYEVQTDDVAKHGLGENWEDKIAYIVNDFKAAGVDEASRMKMDAVLDVLSRRYDPDPIEQRTPKIQKWFGIGYGIAGFGTGALTFLTVSLTKVIVLASAGIRHVASYVVGKG